MSPTPTTGDVFIIEDAPSLEPRLVEKLRGQSIASLAAGFTRTAVLTNPGTAQSITHAIDQLAPLDALIYLYLGNCANVHGDVGALAAIGGTLERLRLDDTAVGGSVEPLAALTGLTYLGLANTDVRGDATVIRSAVPGLSEWGFSDPTNADWLQYHFTACDTVSCSIGERPRLRGDAEDYAGRNEDAGCVALPPALAADRAALLAFKAGGDDNNAAHNNCPHGV